MKQHKGRASWRKFTLLAVSLLCMGYLSQAQVRLSGKVTGADQAPLPGISVFVKSTTLGTTTDADGKFTIEGSLKNGSYQLEFTGVGFKPQTKNFSVPLSGSSFDVQMEPDVLGLNEVIVTGTSVATSKKVLGNAVSTVSADAIRFSAATGIDGALQGKVAGAQITQNSGNPAGGISVRLRGPSTITGSSDPLYIVDGVIVNNDSRELIDLGGYAQNRLVDISPNDIERIEIIKGAAAAAIYGSRANNGVVQIFTKRGKAGKPQISFTTNLRTNSLRKALPFNEYPFRFNNPTNNTDLTQTPVERFDYQDKIFRTGLGTENNLSIAGGTEQTKYYVGLNNTFNQGIIDKTSFSRNGIRLNINQKISPVFSMSAGANYTLSSSKEIPNGGISEAYGALTGFIFSNNFINPERDPVTGVYPSTAPVAILRRTNPLEAINRFDFGQTVNRFIGNVQLNAKPMEGLNIDLIFGLDNYTQNATGYIPPRNTTPSYDAGLSRRADATVLQTNTDLNISYKKQLNSWLESTTGLGGTIQYIKTTTFGANAQQLGLFGQTINNGTIVASEFRSEQSIMGAFLQQTFGLGDKFFITGAGRVDASSVYGINNRWQFFPKVSGSYVLSQEPFFYNSSFGKAISSMKLRAAWGQSGNLTAIGAFDRFTNFAPVNYGGATGYISGAGRGNVDVLPERQVELEIGTDISFFNEKLSLEFTYFRKDVQDLLLQRNLAPTTGFSNQFFNIGNMSNRGFEALVKAVPVQTKDFSWVTSVSYTHNKNQVFDVPGTGVLTFPGGFGQVAAVNGEPLGAFYSAFFARNPDGSLLLTPAGLPQRERGVQGVDGKSTVQRDQNGQPSGAILSKVIGNPNPLHIVSFNNEFEYKNWSFRMLWDGMFGFDVFNFTRRVGENPNYGGLKGYESELRGDVPKGTANALFPIFENWIEKGDFAKLREISVSYMIIPKAGKIRNIRLSLSGRNLLSIDNYSGYDPEVNAAGQSTAVRGFDFVEVPIPRTFALGLNLNF